MVFLKLSDPIPPGPAGILGTQRFWVWYYTFLFYATYSRGPALISSEKNFKQLSQISLRKI